MILGNAGYAQRGNKGDLIVSSQNQWVNTYTSLNSNANAGANAISVSNNSLLGNGFTTNLTAGDLILIIQMQGASVDVNTTPTASWGGSYTVQNSWITGTNPDWDPIEYGQVLAYNNAGNFEYVEVASVSGANTINLNCQLEKSYTVSGHVQVIRVPRYNNLTINNNSSISCPLWSGTTGGVIAIEVDGDLVLNGTGKIDANSKGFRGGQTASSTFTASSSGDSGGYLGSYNAQEGSEKGESIAGFYTEYDALFSRYCKGSIANGGGGANYHNAGGGGGSNVASGSYYSYGVPDLGAGNGFVPAWNIDPTIDHTLPSSGGGRGGYSHASSSQNPLTQAPNTNAWSGDFRRFAFGYGGHALNYDADRIFFGGGGGAGHENDGDGGNGGRGGGIICCKVFGSVSGSGSFEASGEDGFNAEGPAPAQFSTQKSGDDGAGGAGGGGCIYIENLNPIPSGITLTANGGDGGDQILQLGNFAANTMDGTGGGGAGGMLAFTSGNPTENVLGGASGVSTSSIANNFPPNGATNGSNGISGLTSVAYDLIVLDDTICGGGSANLTVSVLGTLNPGSTIEWYTNQYGGSSINSGNTYNTPILATNTTYWVGVCPGFFRVPVNVLVSPALNINGVPTISDETCAGNDGEISGLTASGGFGNLIFEWNGVLYPDENLTNAVGGSYSLLITDENGCFAESGPYTITASPGPSVDATNVNISEETCIGSDGSITGIIVTGNNLTYSWNGVTTLTADTVGLNQGVYNLLVTDDNGCTASSGPFTIELNNGPVIDTNAISVIDETCFGQDGSISGISVSGNVVSFAWNGTVGSLDTLNLISGNYTLVATDDNGCETSMGPIVVDLIPSPTIDDSNISIQGENCNQFDGSITGIVATGNGLNFEWNGINSPNENISNQPAGNYTLTVTDNIGCNVTSGPYEIPSIGGPAIIDTNLVVVDETCANNNGNISGLAVDGSNFTILWNGTVASNIDLSDLSAGQYELTIIDFNGCTSQYGPILIDSISSPSLDDSGLVLTEESCEGNDGSIQGLVATGVELSYAWNGEESTSINISNIVAGNYSLIITDSNGCTLEYGPLEIIGNNPPNIILNPNYTEIDFGNEISLNLTISNADNDIINWTPSDGLSCTDCNDPIASPSETTTYYVTVSNEAGCTSMDSVLVVVNNPCGEIFIPSIFSPNNDGLHEELCVYGGCIESIKFEIFDRWGNRHFYTEDETACWDGFVDGKKLNSGVYIYKATGVRIDGSEFTKVGNITVTF